MSSARTPVRMLASDLDGTLLRGDGTVSDVTRGALRRATEAGLLVTFVTGRPPRWLHEVADRTGHLGVAVSANGAVLYDLASETVLQEHLIDPVDLATLTRDLRAAFPEVLFAVEYGLAFGHEPGYRHHWEISPTENTGGRGFHPTVVAELAEVIARPGVKLLAKDREADADGFLAAAAELLAGRATVTRSSSFGLLEISLAGVNKATGLAEVAAQQGITAAEVVAVGDMPNDLPMLAWAGTSYAVRNAHPAVLAAADHTLPSNDEDGVAALIDTLLA